MREAELSLPSHISVSESMCKHHAMAMSPLRLFGHEARLYNCIFYLLMLHTLIT